MSSLASRALKACDDVMNAFRRTDGDENDPRLLDEVVNRCREIAWEVLGPLDEKSLKRLCVWDRKERPGQIWAIGHW